MSNNKAMEMEKKVVKIDPHTETICCDGGQDGLGPPAVYYTFDETNKIICSYCGET